MPLRPRSPSLKHPGRVVVGLVGGIASGKSAVAQLFRKCGARTEDADRIAHEALDRPDVRDEIVRHWGPTVVAGGRVDRQALGAVAFRSKDDIGRLNSIVHPVVAQELLAHVAGAQGVVVIEAALLLESGAAAMCDFVVCVDVPARVREKRAASRGWTPGERRRREGFQWPMARKRAAADFIVRNGGTLAATEKQVRSLYARFLKQLQK